jgi:hypothetical protein
VVRKKGVTMGEYLDILRRAEQPHTDYDINDINDKRYMNACSLLHAGFNQLDAFGRLCRFCRTLDELERRCPAGVDATDWHQAIEDGRRFVAQWGEQAEALGWTPADLFGLHSPPKKLAPSYRRLSRYDETGLIWLLRDRPVIALTATEAVMRCQIGATLKFYRRTESVAPAAAVAKGTAA